MDNRHTQQLIRPQRVDVDSLDRSPLRGGGPDYRRLQNAPDYYHSSNKTNIDISAAQAEEDEYNRRRSEGLRKQLQANIRQRNESESKMHQSFGGAERSFDRGVSERESATHFTLGAQQQRPEELAPHLKEHLTNIQNDNQSLMRRLNLVVQELERVNRERDDLKTRLACQSREGQELNRVINCEDDVDKVNKYMQDDLAYERDRNYKIKQQIKEIDLYRTELLRDLRKLQEIQDGTMKDNKDFTYQLQQKLVIIEDLDKEFFYTQEKIRQASHAIERAKVEGEHQYSEKCELSGVIEQLQGERNDLLERLEHLTKKYDECVREISIDRAEMEAHNKQHAKLITSKVIFKLLEGMMKQRMLLGFSEFKTYCSFDTKCHHKLSKLSKILEKLGKFKLRVAMQEWLQKSMKPVEMKVQSLLLSQKAQDISVQQRFYAKWRRAYLSRVSSYDSKTRSILALWSLATRDSLIEKKRALTIWKETMLSARLTQSKLKKLLWSLHSKKLQISFNTWQNMTSSLNQQVRMNLLMMRFSHQHYLTSIFHALKYQTTEAKRKRQNRQRHIIKAWKEQMQYEKFLMGSNLAALKLRRNFNISMAKASFDALRENKESEKLMRTQGILQGEELPRIEALREGNETFELERKLQRLTQACTTVKTQMAKRLWSYIVHWRSVNEDYKETLRTTLKDKIIKHYMSSLRVAFTHWHKNTCDLKVQLHQQTVSDMQYQQKELQNEVYTEQREIQDKREIRDQTQKKHTLRVVEAYERRMKQLGWGRWRDRVGDISIKEDGAATVIRRLRLRLLRKAFDLYQAGVQFHKKTISDEERCAQYQRLREERVKQQVYHAWTLFKRDHTKAKQYWYRIYLRLDLSMKHSALKKWHEFTQKRAEKELHNLEKSKIETIEDLNNELGQLHIDETAQKQDIAEKKKVQLTQARRIISNAFARFYSSNLTRGFEKWREVVEYERNRERLLKKFVNHWRKYQFYCVRAGFKNWILKADIDERRDQVKKEEFKIKDTEFQRELQTKQFEEDSETLNSQIQQTVQEQKKYSQRLGKSINLIVNKVQGNYSTGQKRYILTHWREYVKREVNFIKCTRNVIQKSLWNFAFQQIREHARQNTRQHLEETVLTLFRQKFWKRTCGNAFSVWRSGQFQTVTQTLIETTEENIQAIEDHASRKQQIVEHNAVRAERLITTHSKKNILQSWKNVTQYLKLQNAKDDYCRGEIEYFQRRNALKKWQSRKQATKIARKRYSELKSKVRSLRLKFYFEALRNQTQATTTLCKRLANLGNVMDMQMLKHSFIALGSFSRAKTFVFDKRQENAAFSLNHFLEGAVLRRKGQYFGEFKIKCNQKKSDNWVKGFTIIGNFTKSLRWHFQQWREGAELRSVAKEMHEEGPIREDAFDKRNKLINLTDFLHKEGYDDQEILGALQVKRVHQEQIQLKAVRRMQHYNEELYTKPKFFDRWRSYIYTKRLFKYYLKFAAKKSELVKADLHWAFDKWNEYHSTQKSLLQKKPKVFLDGKMICNNLTLAYTADEVQTYEQSLQHMQDQREALLEQYIKSQKLALTLWKNHHKKSLHQGFLRWSKASKGSANLEKTAMLRKNLSLLDSLKQKISHLEQDNDTLANENEELRQFSLDGYEIAKNVQSLTGEREKLSVDLADKAQMIRKLLDENERLTHKLRMAQDEAHSMIRSTMAGSSGFKTGAKGPGAFASPFTKSNGFY